jgi:hypothetical protein
MIINNFFYSIFTQQHSTSERDFLKMFEFNGSIEKKILTYEDFRRKMSKRMFDFHGRA